MATNEITAKTTSKLPMSNITQIVNISVEATVSWIGKSGIMARQRA